MPIRNLDPPSAHAEMNQAPDHVFLDVRTPEEYVAGHPAGSINVPWALRDASGAMVPNPDFVSTVEQHVPRGKRVYCSCLSGGRSLYACRDLEGAGYEDLANVDGGFGGKRDPAGRLLIPGWKDSGLPVSQEPGTF